MKKGIITGRNILYGLQSSFPEIYPNGIEENFEQNHIEKFKLTMIQLDRTQDVKSHPEKITITLHYVGHGDTRKIDDPEILNHFRPITAQLIEITKPKE